MNGRVSRDSSGGSMIVCCTPTHTLQPSVLSLCSAHVYNGPLKRNQLTVRSACQPGPKAS